MKDLNSSLLFVEYDVLIYQYLQWSTLVYKVLLFRQLHFVSVHLQADVDVLAIFFYLPESHDNIVFTVECRSNAISAIVKPSFRLR